MTKELIKRNIFILVISMIVFFLMSLFVTTQIERKNMQQQLLGMSKIIANVIMDDTNTEEEVVVAVNKFAKEQDWMSVCVANSLGTIIVDSSSDAMGEGHFGIIEQDELSKLSNEKGKNRVYIKNRYMYYIEKLNDDIVLRTAVIMDDNTTLILENVFFLLVMLVFMLTLSILTTKQTSKRVVDAFNNVTENLRSLSEGNYRPIETAHKYEEVSGAYREINTIGQSINTYIDTIEEERDKVNYIINNAAGGIVIIDEKNNVFSANTYAQKVFNINMVMGEPISNFITDTNILDMIEKTKTSKKELYIDYHPDYVDKYYHIAFNCFTREGTGDLVSMSMYDVTDATKEEIRNKEFISNVSHELRTPITTISGFAELLAIGLVQDEKTQKAYISNIYNEAVNMRHIITELLYLSKLDFSNRNMMEKKELALDELISRICVGYEGRAQQDNVQLTCNANPAQIVGNESLLEHLITNIIDNAFKYASESDKKVVVECGVDENGKSYFSVTDNGQGIAEQDKQRIFEKFYRTDASRNRDTGGTGLGLTIVKKVCALHGAEINIESEIGQGSKFTVTF